jgi:hypothetical protein
MASMSFDRFDLDESQKLVVGDRSLDLHNVTPLRRYTYVSRERRFELELEGANFTRLADGSGVSHHHRVLFTFHDVRFVRTQSASVEHLDVACLIRFRRVSAELLLSEVSSMCTPEGRGPLRVQVEKLFTSDELEQFGGEDYYEISFVNGPSILVSSPRITADWTTREELLHTPLENGAP